VGGDVDAGQPVPGGTGSGKPGCSAVGRGRGIERGHSSEDARGHDHRAARVPGECGGRRSRRRTRCSSRWSICADA
jgi:hypothetical protein